MNIGKIISAIFGIPGNLWLGIIANLPGPIGFRLRYLYWKMKLGHLGRKTRIDIGVRFQNPKMISIGDNCWIDRGVDLLAGIDTSTREKIVRNISSFPGQPGGIHIGNNIHIGANCIISGISQGVYISDDCGLSSGCRIYAFVNHYRSIKYPENRNISFTPMINPSQQCLVEGPVFIGTNVGLALNAIILPGTRIGNNSFITINSVIKGAEFDENSLIAGNPAKVQGKRFEDNE